MLYKFIWALRAIFLAPLFGKIKFPGYIGKPIILSGTKKIFIGKFVRIFPHIRMEVLGSDGSIIIQDDVSIAQNVHITSGGSLVIGKSTTILANTFITNIDHDYTELDVSILKQKYIIKDTIIGDNCFIGMGSCIQAGTVLGKQCIVGASSVVRGIFPNYCVIVGAPAKIIKRYNPISQEWERTDIKGNFVK